MAAAFAATNSIGGQPPKNNFRDNCLLGGEMPLHGEFNYKQLLPAHAHDQYMILLESPTRKTAKLLIETALQSA